MAPFLETRLVPLDDVAVVVDPVQAGDRQLVAFGVNRGTRTGAPDVIAEAMVGLAMVTLGPLESSLRAMGRRHGCSNA